MENDPHNKTWVELQDHGLLPNIKCWEDYVAEFEVGLSKARPYLATQPKLWSQKTILTTHRLIFENITPWAGQTSTRQEIIASIPGSPPELRDFEFQLLEAQMEILEAAATTPTAKIRMAAFHHSRLLCMHPFRDGNGRTARLILSKQLDKLIGKAGPLACTRSEYIDTLQACHPTGNLAPLSNLLHRSLLGIPDPAKFLPVPFRMNSLQLIPSRPENALDESFRELPTVIQSKGTPEQVNWLTRIPWSEVERLCSAKPTKNLEAVKMLWTENLKTPFSTNELKHFLNKLENLNPWTQATGLLRLSRGTSWSPVLSKVLEPWHEAYPRTSILNPTPEL
jgi:fido (protein-threonine AMPylation protein)